MSEFKLGTEKAKIYALGKSSSEVFRKAHEQDFLNGYNQALKDCCAPEMLEILDKIITGYENAGGEMWIPDMIQEHIFTAKKIIKKATE